MVLEVWEHMREMKDSGGEWIGEIPEDWDKKRLKAVLCERNESNNPVKTDFILSLTNDRGVIPYTEKGDSGNKSKDDLTGYKLAHINDIVLNSMNVIIGSVGLSRYYGCVSPVYYMLYPRYENDCVRYYNYLFQTQELQSKLKGFGNGIMEIRMRIPMSKLNMVELPIPPYKMQYYIADYLDEKCYKIDNLIAKQRELIIKLGAYKKSIITEAVTKGLNPNAEMKDSGIEWIGKMPKNWSIHKLCWDYSTMLGKMLDVKRITGQHLHPYIKNMDVEWGNINIDNLDEMDFEDHEIERYSVLPGDLMICEGGEIGKCAIVPDTFPKGIYYQKALHRVRKREKNSGNIKFLYYVIFCMAKNDCFGTSPEKATIAHLPENDLKQLRIPVPCIDEQKEIADFLDKKCSAIDAAVNIKQKVVDKLSNYKKSLIYEVVTGKKEVI